MKAAFLQSLTHEFKTLPREQIENAFTAFLTRLRIMATMADEGERIVETTAGNETFAMREPTTTTRTESL
jgi:hypothetical protein